MRHCLHDSWHFLWHIPIGQSLAFREMRGDAVLLSPDLPGALFPLGCMLPTAGRTQNCKFIARPVGLHLVSSLLSFAGLGVVLTAAEPRWRGEELYFSEGLSGTPDTLSNSPCYSATFLRSIPKLASFVCANLSSVKPLFKHPSLGS